MFCQNCGNEISDNGKFCPACGAAVNQIEVKKESAVSNQKDLTGSLRDCLSHFSKISEIYNFRRTGLNLINNTVWRKKVNSNFTVGFIFFILGIVTFIPTFKAVVDSEWVLIIFLWEVLLAEIVSAVVGGISALIYGKHKETIKFYETKISVMERKIEEHYNLYENCPLAIEYTAPDTINTLISYLNSGRAENLKEAINLYEDECHKAQMITEMKEMKAAAQQAATAATITAINSL